MKKLLADFNQQDLRVFKEEFLSFLPETIMDTHVHLWKKDFLKKEVTEERMKKNPFLDHELMAGFSFEDFKILEQKLFPGKAYGGLFFGLPFLEVNLHKMNAYIAEVCKKNNSWGLFAARPDLEEIPHDFFEKKFVGFKPYPDFAVSKHAQDFSKLDIDVSLFDFISKKVLDFSEEHGLILLIHLPRKGRLNDQRNIEEIRSMAKQYPNIKIILAHAGRSYCYYDIKDSIAGLKDIKNLYMDTAMVNSFRVIEVLIRELGCEKILYGSDLAVAALKGKNIDINHKHYFVTSTPKPWSLSSDEMTLEDMTFFIYEIIRAIKVAAEKTSISKAQINKIFYVNARKLLEDIVQKKP